MTKESEGQPRKSRRSRICRQSEAPSPESVITEARRLAKLAHPEVPTLVRRVAERQLDTLLLSAEGCQLDPADYGRPWVRLQRKDWPKVFLEVR